MIALLVKVIRRFQDGNPRDVFVTDPDMTFKTSDTTALIGGFLVDSWSFKKILFRIILAKLTIWTR